MRGSVVLPETTPLDGAPFDDAPVGPAPRRYFIDRSIGIVPIPVAIVIVAIVAVYVSKGPVPADLTTAIAVLALGGFACAEIGKRIPGLRRIGAAAILATFIPSYLVYVHAIPKPLEKAIKTFTDQSNFLYLFIAAIIVGSILGMDRRILIGGFLKIFVPIFTGSVVAIVAGCLTGMALGIDLQTVAFKIVVPVLAGGVGEGAIPLSIGYAAIHGGDQGVLLAEILPAVMFGSLTAILLAGGLNLLGRRRPALTGHGMLQPGEADVPLDSGAVRFMPDLATIGAALVLAMTLYMTGAAGAEAHRLSGTGDDAVSDCGVEAGGLRFAASRARRVPQLSVCGDLADLSLALRDRGLEDSLGQAHRRVQCSGTHHHSSSPCFH